jgi:hypothetical protein
MRVRSLFLLLAQPELERLYLRESKQKHSEFQFSLISVKVLILNVTVVKRAI